MIESRRLTFLSMIDCDFFIHNENQADELFIVLHGFDDKAKRMFRLFKTIIPKNACLIAPNGPFPIAHKEENKIKLSYAWYFYDIFEKTYHIGPKIASGFVKRLVENINPILLQRPITVIGYSQGGYLAPFVGLEFNSTKKVIGINCEFRYPLLPEKMPFELINIHGRNDEIVNHDNAKKSHSILIDKGNRGKFITIENSGHFLTPECIEKVHETIGTGTKLTT